MSFSHQVLWLSPLWLVPGKEAYTKPLTHRLPVLMHISEYRSEKGDENTKIKEKKIKLKMSLRWFLTFAKKSKHASGEMETDLANKLWWNAHWTHATAFIQLFCAGTCAGSNNSSSNLLSCTLPGRPLVLNPVCNICFFYILFQPCFGTLPSPSSPSSTYKASVVYCLQPRDANLISFIVGANFQKTVFTFRWRTDYRLADEVVQLLLLIFFRHFFPLVLKNRSITGPVQSSIVLLKWPSS